MLLQAQWREKRMATPFGFSAHHPIKVTAVPVKQALKDAIDVSGFDSMDVVLWLDFIDAGGGILALVAHDELPDTSIFLPGISSYDISEDDIDQEDLNYSKTWSWKINFFREFVKRFADNFAKDYPGFSPSMLASCVDYHWYHRTTKSTGKTPTLGPQHITRLVWEVGQIRAALDAVGMTSTAVSVFESGVSSLFETDDYVPPDVSMEVWQAREVWRRLAGAKAAGAIVAGWNSWHSSSADSSSEWYGLGLRQDDTTTNKVVAISYQKLSWFSYSRLTSVLQAVTSTAVVLPTNVPVDSDSPIEDDAIVVEFSGIIGNHTTQISSTGIYAYAYLVMMDQWRGSSSNDLIAKPHDEEETSWVEVQTISTSHGETSTGPSLPNSSPMYFPVLETETNVPAHGVVVLCTGQPRLFLARKKLDWSIYSSPFSSYTGKESFPKGGKTGTIPGGTPSWAFPSTTPDER